MKTCAINNIDLSYIDRGAGTVLLLAHGFPLDHSMWNPQIEALSSTYRVIAPDLRGLGQSGLGQGISTMEHFADDLAALLDHLTIRDPVVLCGLSMGGYVAMEFWRKHAARLKGLILCDTRAACDSPEVFAGRSAFAQRVMAEGPHWVADTMFPRIFAPITLKEQPHLIESMRRVIDRTDPRGIAAAALGMAQRADYLAVLPQIRCPTLVIVGEHDIVSPVAEMKAIAQSIPNAQFSVIERAGHMSPLEQPAAVNAIIESFLQQL
jgi:3-oxoadipate enol-lactonase